jgi:hypothetical protein
VNQPANTQPVVQERLIVWLLCALAAAHVFLYSAAFPFFNPIDEILHFDTVIKYSHGHVPRGIEHLDPDARLYIIYYSSPEYWVGPEHYRTGAYPTPPWLLPKEKSDAILQVQDANMQQVIDDENAQPPLYYFLTGLCWHVGQALGLSDSFLLYGMRFLNVFIVGAVVWLAYLAGRVLFPDQPFVRLGAASLAAFLPQSAFYAIENDALSPVSFGLAFYCLLRWLRGDELTFRLATGTGLALAATYLTKLSNLPLLGVSAVIVGLRVWQLQLAGGLRRALPALAVFLGCALVPVACWMTWMKIHFGDFTGEAQHVLAQGWIRKPFGQWWQHPIFTPSGFWTYLSTLLAHFWNGELYWHGRPLSSRALDVFYTLLSLGALGGTLVGLLGPAGNLTAFQRRVLWFCLASFISGIVFLGALSLPYDYQACVQPSRAHPYFSSGRLILGAVVPFFLMLLYAMDVALKAVAARWARPLVLGGLILFMISTEIASNRAIFTSEYNWFHL